MKLNNRPRSTALPRFFIISAVLIVNQVTFLLAQSPLKISEKSYGIFLSNAAHGGTIGGYYVSDLGRKLQFNLQGGIMDVRADTEFPIVDPYTGYTYQARQTNAIIFPFIGGFRFHPFMDKIANSFSPFFSVSVGPIVALDPPDKKSFLTAMGSSEVIINMGGLFTLGADIIMPSSSFFSISFGYNVFHFQKAMDGESDFSGGVLQIMFGKRVRIL